MRYKIFSERTGLKVSELALGTGMFGQAWGYGATPEEVSRIIAGFADAGGNFIDIADNYQQGVSDTGGRGYRGEPRRLHYRHEVHARRLR
jgi:aryl-alcohol dehydrogenase-like predicted oxidoreductase